MNIPTPKNEPVSDFESKIRDIINIHSKENASDTPDWVLAEYLNGCLDTFNLAVQRREVWYGRTENPITGIKSGIPSSEPPPTHEN